MSLSKNLTKKCPDPGAQKHTSAVTMKCLLLALGLALICSIHAIYPAKRNVDVQKLSGPWYTVMLVTNNRALLEKEDAPLRMSVKDVQPTPEGNMEIFMVKRENDRCVEKKIIAQKTEIPTEFSTRCMKASVHHREDLDENKMFVIDTDYSNFLVFCLESTIAPKQNVVCQCLARTQNADAKVVEKCNQVLKSLHLQNQFTLDFTQKEAQKHTSAATMKCLLLALGLALVCSIHAIYPAKRNVDVQKLAGAWKTVMMVTNNRALLEKEDAPLRMSVKEVQPTPKGNMEIFLVNRENNRCVEKKIVAQKTEIPAEFSTKYLDENKMVVIDTDYSNFLVFCLESTIAPKQNVVCQCLARTQNADAKVVEKCNQVLKSLHLQNQFTLDFTQKEELGCRRRELVALAQDTPPAQQTF
ncbi:PREDICTED: uncharacterized protein LOC102831484 [Chrysochloris asiatica]|uniref:Uncharacterized protein LOC102831484 n=1 Tax=Chrysochloris asiatica TaxID=185453 RepID=A0A9B0WQ71_CHRAS|nr:PREDICTED: uncharacterized protein LOC102831484 [Chrysochloris asiatica]